MTLQKTIDNIKKKLFTIVNKGNILGGFVMAGALMDKVWGLFGMDTQEDEDYDEDDYYDEEDEEVDDKKIFGRKNIISSNKRRKRPN